MSYEETVTVNLEVDATPAEQSMSELIRTITTYQALARRLGLPENVDAAIMKLQQFRLQIQMTQRALTLLSAGGALSTLSGVGVLALVAITLMDQMRTRRPRY